MTILYFTATGNSLHVAKSLGGELLSIPQMIKQEKYTFEDDKIGIVFPLYEWSVNALVADFLKKATFKTDYLFAIATYGIFAGGVGSHLVSIANKTDYKFSYISKIKMVDNWLPGFSMKKQIESEHKKYIEENIAQIKADIENSKKSILKESVIRKRMTSFMVNRSEKPKGKSELRGIKKDIIVEDSCIQCGVCVSVCPVNNITLDNTNGKIALQNKCFSCYACLQNCPQNAIHLKNEKDRSRFRNKHVSLKEIIDSNT